MECAVAMKVWDLIEKLPKGDETEQTDSENGDSGDGGETPEDAYFITYILVMMFITLILRSQGCICGGAHIFGKKCLLPPEEVGSSG